MIIKVTSEGQRYLRSAESAYARRTPTALLGPQYVSASSTFTIEPRTRERLWSSWLI